MDPGALTRLVRRGLPAVGTTPADVVHREHKWQLLHYRRATPAGSRVPVLLVPSLINRHYVLDLMPGKSLVDVGAKPYWATNSGEARSVDSTEHADTSPPGSIVIRIRIFPRSVGFLRNSVL